MGNNDGSSVGMGVGSPITNVGSWVGNRVGT